MSKDWTYGNYHKKYDMEGEIHIGTGIVKVHDIFNPLPDFMKQADVIFCDPPCSKQNLSSFYTKADIEKDDRPYLQFSDFENRLFECIEEIYPRLLILEVFHSNAESFSHKMRSMYKNFYSLESTYYHNAKNTCNILVASNDAIPTVLLDLKCLDEEDVIEFICKNLEFNCIGDLCMGKGLVGFFANKYGKKFVGTELNEKRLAILIERITTGKKGSFV